MALQLLIEDFDGAQTVVPLDGDEVTIGRTEGNTIQLTEQNVSRKHARLVMEDGAWFIEDLDSYNGIRVNGAPIAGRLKLDAGDALRIGDYTFSLLAAGEGAVLGLAGGEAANFATTTVDEPRGPGTAGSLPRLAAAPTPPLGEDHEHEGGRTTGAGAAMGGLLAAVAAASLVGAWALGLFGAGTPGAKGGPDDKVVVASANGDAKAASNGATASTPTGLDPAAESDPAPVPVPTADAPTGADADAGEPADAVAPGDADAGAAESPSPPDSSPEPAPTKGEPPPDEPAPTSKKSSPAGDPVVAKGQSGSASGKSGGKSSKAPEEAQPAGDPKALLADARKASVSGDHAGAYKLAKQSYGIDKNADALQLMGVAACKMGDEKKASAVHAKLSGSKKAALEKLCTASGVTLAAG